MKKMLMLAAAGVAALTSPATAAEPEIIFQIGSQGSKPAEASVAPTVVIKKTEVHNVREEAIERVARQLAASEGKDPNADLRCSRDGTMMNCNAVFWPYPTYLGWNAYRDRAEKILKDAFADHPANRIDKIEGNTGIIMQGAG